MNRMTRRKQSKPRALQQHDDEDNKINKPENGDEKENILRDFIKNEPEMQLSDGMLESEAVDGEEGTEDIDEDELENESLDSQNDDSIDSFSSELYSSQTSSSFPSEGFATPNSFIHDQEMPEKDKLDENDRNNNENGENFKLKYERSGSKTKIGKDGLANYQCQFCDKSFPRLGYLKKHEQSHAEHMPFKCDYCARLFKHKRSRDRHTKLHTGDRRYRCPQCESAFSRSDHLKIHRKTHDKNKPFQCVQCNRGYNTAAALTSHMQNHKKQAALGNHSAFTYSPRSTGSASSHNSNKRKYSTTLLEHKSQRSSPSTPSTINLSCFYCTKSDFASIEQLNLHINTMHSNKLMTNATELQFRIQQQQHKAFYENFQISCEFCTMKFQTIEKMFEHIKHLHLDRINSPNHYLEYFNRNLCNTYGFNGGLEGNIVDGRKSKESAKVTENAKEIKLETEDEVEAEDSRSTDDLPTDLSQPKIKKFKEERRSDIESKADEKKSLAVLPSPDRRSVESTAPPTAFLCNQCNASLPDFESFRLHLRSHLEQSHNSANSGLNLLNGAQPANNYVCHQCGLTLDKKSDYEHHIEQHFTIINTEFLCQFCNKFFPKAEDLQKHLNENHVETIYKCSLCKEVFETKISIQLHFAVQHSNEIKLYRCSVCMDVFRLEKEFRHHVRTRHLSQNSIQCVFCRVVCSTELEMHFHLAAHVKQFRCPACTESFHVEFLLDRHLQTHHANKENGHNEPPKISPSSIHASASNNENAYNHLIKNSNFYNYQITNKFYHNPHGDNFGGKPPHPTSSSALMFNSNIYDTLKTSAHLYSPPIDKSNHRGDFSKSKLLSFYGSSLHHHQEILANKLNNIYANKATTEATEDFYPRKTPPAPTVKTSLYLPPVGLSTRFQGHSQSSMLRSLYEKSFLRQSNDTNNNVSKSGEPENNQVDLQKQQQKVRAEQSPNECGMCERNDFASEIDLQTHRKIAHNLKTGVSLSCAYCSGGFRSRTELENHMKVQHNIGGKHKCLICDEILPSPAVLAEHKLQHCKVGASGKCSICSIELKNINDFKEHLKKHTSNEMQCVCCRQILSSEFEITLHAKFHTKSAEVNEERTCALCLEILPTNNGKKICEGCIKKHNFTNQASASSKQTATNSQPNAENIPIQCNLCKKVQANSVKLQQHLIDHEFFNSNGYSCYICTSIFTSAAGLQQHIHQEHENSDKDSNTKPYDCNVCEAKFFFRTELEHHQLFHVPASGSHPSISKQATEALKLEEVNCENEIKQEVPVKDTENEEYIEVELVK